MEPPPGGEKCYPKSTDVKDYGLPPRGRGKDLAALGCLRAVRITPAWAGKRLTTPARPRRWTDHPRVGGEKTVTEKGETQRTGSPPHGRGKAGCSDVSCTGVGITPAQAGKSRAVVYARYSSQDHPRVGGEKCVPVSWATGPTGSPPHRRGKGTHAGCAGGVLGITPA